MDVEAQPLTRNHVPSHLDFETSEHSSNKHALDIEDSHINGNLNAAGLRKWLHIAWGGQSEQE